MSVLDHAECFKSASRLLCRGTKRLKGINSRLKHDLIIIHYQNINGIELHIFSLLICCRNIQCYGERCALTLRAPAFYQSAHQFNHLLCNGETEACSLYTVDTAVYLT